MPDMRVREPGRRPAVRALVGATHPGPAAAVTVVATLLAVAAGVPAGRTAPWTTGLSGRATARSRSASSQSLLHPMDA